MSKDQICIRLDEIHLDIIDSLQPFYGNSRPEVIRNLVIRWIEQNIGSANLEKLKEIGAIKK
jgi:hypothetical protein